MRFPRLPPVNICLLWFLIGLFYFLYLLWLGRLITNGETPLRYDSGNASENDAKKLTSHAFKLFHDHHISTFHSVIWKLGNQTGPEVRRLRLNSDRWRQIYGIDVRVLRFSHFVSLLGWDVKDIYKDKNRRKAIFNWAAKGLFFLKGGGGYTHSGYHKTLSATIACDRTSCETDPFERLS